ncbi:hypothetical protein C0J45_4263, partial [Silurus meridionalis]
ILLIGPKTSIQKLQHLNLHLDGCSVTTCSTVKDLGVILDSNLSFKYYINQVTKTAFFHLRNISKLRKMLSISDAEKLVHAFMTSRIDYCNALLGGCPAEWYECLYSLHAVIGLVFQRSRARHTHVSPEFCRFAFLHVSTHVTPVGFDSASLRSQNSGLLVVPRMAKSTKGGRAFSHLAPKLWNSLPDGVRGSDTLTQFKCRLKTYLF